MSLELADLVARVLGGEEEANSLLILKMALEPGCRAQAKHLFVQTLHTKAPFPLLALERGERPVSQGEVRLAFKLRLCGFGNRPCVDLALVEPLFSFIKSAQTSEAMKVVLIEFLATNQRNDDLLSFFVWLIKNEPLDKARACAVFAWAKQGWDYSQRGDAQRFLSDLWATVCDGTSSAGDGVRPLGPLTEAALAIVTLRLVYRPPAAAVERAVALIQNSLELEQAWVDVDGGESLLAYPEEPHPVPITELVPEEHLPLVMEHIALHRQREPTGFAQPTSSLACLGLTPEQLALLPARMRAEVDRQLALANRPDQLCLPVGWEDLELAQLAFTALGDSDRCWAQAHACRCLLERLSGQADPKPTRRMLYCLLSMRMADPLPEEKSYYAPELDPALVQVLNELAFDDRYAAFWRVVDTFSQVENEAADEEEGEDEEEAPLTNPFQLFGLPPDRSSLQAWLQTPLPPQLAGRKRFPHLAGLEAFAWDSVGQAYGSGVDLPKYIRMLVASEPKLRMSALQSLGISAFHQGTYYSSTPLVAKWISAVLDYEDSPDKHELVMFLLLMAGSPGQCLLAGFARGENPIWRPLALETLQEMARNLDIYRAIVRQKRECPTTRFLVLQLLAMFPDKGGQVVDDLLALWRDHSERLALRVMALVVLSFVTPSPSDGGASQQFQRVVATLASLLAPAPGEVRSLAEMAADCAATPGAPTLKKRKRDEGNEEGEEEALVAPAEVRELLAARTSLQPGSAAHSLAQFCAATGLCRMLMRALGFSGPDGSVIEELELKIMSGELQQRLSSSGGLVRDIAKLVPAVQQALSLRPACQLHPGLGDESASGSLPVGLSVLDVPHPHTFLDGFDSTQLHAYERVLGLIPRT